MAKCTDKPIKCTVIYPLLIYYAAYRCIDKCHEFWIEERNIFDLSKPLAVCIKHSYCPHLSFWSMLSHRQPIVKDEVVHNWNKEFVQCQIKLTNRQVRISQQCWTSNLQPVYDLRSHFLRKQAQNIGRVNISIWVQWHLRGCFEWKKQGCSL